MPGPDRGITAVAPGQAVDPQGSWRLADSVGESFGGSCLSIGLGSASCTATLPPTAEDVVAAEDVAADAVDVEADAETRRRVSLLRRTLTGITASGIRHSMLTLVATALGAASLSVSYVFQLCGLGLGASFLIIGSLLAYLSTVALMEMCTQTGCQTYASLFSHVAGPRAGPCLDLMIFIYGNGVLVLCLVFLGDFIPALVNLAPHMPDWATDRTSAIVFCGVLVFPLGLPKEITALTHFTKFQILGIAYAAILVAVKAPSEYRQNLGKTGYGEPQIFKFDMNIIEALPLCIYAYNCHSNVVPIAGRLLRPTRARIEKLSRWVFLMQLCFYMLIGVSGYLSFLEKTPQEILQLYGLHDPFVVAARALLTFALVVVMGMNLQPAMRSGLRIVDFFRGSSRRDAWAPHSPFGSPPGSPASQSPAVSPPGSPTMSPNPQFSQALQQRESGEHMLPVVTLTATSLAAQVGIAIVVPNAADIIGIVGATAGTAMMLIIPAYAMGVVMPRTTGNLLKQFILYAFAAVSLLSVPVKILKLAGVIPSSMVS